MLNVNGSSMAVPARPPMPGRMPSTRPSTQPIDRNISRYGSIMIRSASPAAVSIIPVISMVVHFPDGVV